MAFEQEINDPEQNTVAGRLPGLDFDSWFKSVVREIHKDETVVQRIRVPLGLR